MPEGTKDKPALSPHRLAFAEAYIKAKLAGADFTHRDIALAAGYRGTPNALDVTASRVIRDPHVLAYMRTRALELMREGAIDAAIALRELTAQRDDKRARLDAARLLGGAIGLMAPEQALGGGPALVINLHLPGTMATQPGADARVIEGTLGDAGGDRSRVEGAGRLAVQLGGPPAAPALDLDQAPPPPGGGDFAKRAWGGGGRSHAAPSKVSGSRGVSRKNSRVGKVGGGSE